MSSDEIAQLNAELQRTAGALQGDLARLSALLGAVFGQAGPNAPPAAAQALARVRIPGGTSVASQLLQVPAVIPGNFASAVDALNYYIGLVAGQGVKDRPYDGHDFAVAAEPLNNNGNSTDIGRNADFVMVLPSIDAQIEFDTPVEPNTPTISGGTLQKHPQRIRKINHKAISTTLTGTISYWAYWWNS